MTFINYAAREINCKIVYYGPGLCGKTTNLQYIYDRTNPAAKGKLISLATETDRTLFFDFLPLDLGTVRGFKTRFHLYTVPGQVFYDASRKLILKGVDGVVFVADSQRERMDAAYVPGVREYFRFWGLDAEKLACAKPDAIVMHPGPMNRGVEIDPMIADGVQSVIREQVEMGVAVRMAVLEALGRHLPQMKYLVA